MKRMPHTITWTGLDCSVTQHRTRDIDTYYYFVVSGVIIYTRVMHNM